MDQISEEHVKTLEKLRQKAIERYALPVGQWTPPDWALFEPKMIYDVPVEKAQKLRSDAVKYAFKRHYLNSRFYKKFCRQLEVKPDDIKTEKDFKKIPLISDIFFKTHPEAGEDFVGWLEKLIVGDLPAVMSNKKLATFDDIIKAYEKEKISLVFSSGTSGDFSFVPRDEITWNRQMYVTSRIFELATFDIMSSKRKIIWLGPNPSKTHLYIGRLTKMLLDLFDGRNIHFLIENELSTEMIKILMGTTSKFSTRMKGGLLRPFIGRELNKSVNRIIDVLDGVEDNETDLAVGGTPFFISMLMSKIKEKGLSFSFPNGIVVTAGGWKTFGGMAIPPEKFRDNVNQIFGISDHNCRDIYGMVECNALNCSCEGHYKHIPHSIVYPMVLDEDSEPLGFGEYGRFAFIDPLARSYPGFVMTGDKVKILEHCPVCDRPGPVIEENVSRLSGVVDRGCGPNLARMFTDEIVKTK